MSDWLQIDIDEDAEIDVEEIMRKIRAHIAQRRLVGEQEGGQVMTLRFRGCFTRVLYDELFEAIRENDRTYVPLCITQSSLPVLGRIIDALRRRVHELVVFYVNRGASRQAAFNNHIVRALGTLIAELEKDYTTKTELEHLQEQVESLKARLDALEGS